jgi:hypothetical protein
MSNAEVQSFTILAIVAGAIITIKEDNLSGSAAATIYYLDSLVIKKINEWPEIGNSRKTTLRCAAHVGRLREPLEASSKLYTACCLGMLAQELLVCLRDMISNKHKLGIIDDLLEAVNACCDIYDPGEREEGMRKEAERLCGVILAEVRG